MKIYRVTAVWRENAQRNDNYKYVLLCGLDEKFRLVEGEWFGYMKNAHVIHPFVLQNGTSCFYGGEEHSFENTDIGDRSIQPETFFDVNGETYEIISCHIYEN